MDFTEQELQEAFANADKIVAEYEAGLAQEEKKDPEMYAIKRFFMQIKHRAYSLRDMEEMRFSNHFCQQP